MLSAILWAASPAFLCLLNLMAGVAERLPIARCPLPALVDASDVVGHGGAHECGVAALRVADAVRRA